jgi:hypothetical protein
MSFRKRLTIAVFLAGSVLALSSTASSAGERTPRVSGAQRAACIPDAMRLCREAMPNIRQVVMCFLGQRAKLSHGCNAVLASYGL